MSQRFTVTATPARSLAWLFSGLALSALLIASTACNQPTPTPSPVPPTVSKPTAVPATQSPAPATPKPTTPAPPSATTSPAPKPTGATAVPPPVTPAATQPPAQGVSLKITEPADETVVNVTPIRVSGTTDIDATVSVNGSIVEVADDGSFTSIVDLADGPNVIEVVASNPAGSQAGKTITVIYFAV